MLLTKYEVIYDAFVKEQIYPEAGCKDLSNYSWQSVTPVWNREIGLKKFFSCKQKIYPQPLGL